MRFIYCFLLLYAFSVKSQEQTRFFKEFEIPDIEFLKFNFIEASTVEIVSSIRKTVKIEAYADGEYKNHLFISTKVFENGYIIKDHLQPFQDIPNDKLAAHKIFSFHIKVEVPQHLKIYIDSKDAHISFKGNCIDLIAELTNGDCRLISFEGNAQVNTIKGDIYVETKNATVKAFSKNGNVEQNAMQGINLIRLYSINGNIEVN